VNASPSGPLAVDAAAWAGHGDLAFVAKGQLEMLDGTGALTAVSGPPIGGYDSSPSWSADGRWLAFLHTGVAPGSGYELPSPTLWLVTAGSAVAHEVTPQGIEMFAWSPVTDELAYAVVTPTNGTVPVPANRYLYLDRPGSSPSPLPIGSGSGVEDLAWSPDGQQIAFDDAEFAVQATATSPGAQAAGQLGVVAVADGSANIVYRLPGSDVRLAAWWPQGGGLLFWEAPGFEEAADGLTLYSVASGSASPAPLLSSLVGPTWVVPEPKGNTVAVVAGGGRSIWSTGRDVELCTFPTVASSATCRAVNPSSSTETLAPSWTASGALLFSVASTSAPFGSQGDADWSPGYVTQWDATNVLWGLTSAGADGRLSSAPPGTVLAAPAAAGSSVLYVADDALWLADTSTPTPAVKVAGPLYSVETPIGYYGEVDWAATFAWSLATGTRQVSAQLIGEALAFSETP
jgi:dipeptidyl aminopeptidase/acylaminoacyl peptidase